jgi:hypothetical protein
MSKNGIEWLVVIALAVGFIGYCNYSDRQRQAPANFDRLLIGSWVSDETATLEDGSVVQMQLQVDFNADHSWRHLIHEPAGTQISHQGTWQLRNDPDLKSPMTSRMLVLTGLGPGASEFLVVFAGDEIVTQFMQREGGKMRRWQRKR